MYERYTDHAKRAIYFAELEARHRNEEVLSPRDILIGLTWDGDSRPERIASLKSRAVLIRAAVGVPHLPITDTPYRQERFVPLDQDCKKILAYATMEANRDGEYWLDSDYLLRGILRVPSVTQRLLNELGIELERLRAASMADRAIYPPCSVSASGKVKMALYRDLGWWSFLLLAAFAFSLIAVIEWWFGPS